MSPVPAKFREIIAGSSLFVLAILFVPGCPDEPSLAVPCGTIPALGCPDKGQECRDATCAALYKCVNGVWRFSMACDYDAAAKPVREASAPIDAGYDPSEAKCPPLEEPDCPKSRASTCASGCCGCEDVFRCVGDAWELAGSCADGGIVLTP